MSRKIQLLTSLLLIAGLSVPFNSEQIFEKRGYVKVKADEKFGLQTLWKTINFIWFSHHCLLTVDDKLKIDEMIK